MFYITLAPPSIEQLMHMIPHITSRDELRKALEMKYLAEVQFGPDDRPHFTIPLTLALGESKDIVQEELIKFWVTGRLKTHDNNCFADRLVRIKKRIDELDVEKFLPLTMQRRP